MAGLLLLCFSFDPKVSSMKALFLAHSPLLRNDTLTSIDNVHVYPLICHMLNIQPKPNNGSLSVFTQYMKQ